MVRRRMAARQAEGARLTRAGLVGAAVPVAAVVPAVGVAVRRAAAVRLGAAGAPWLRPCAGPGWPAGLVIVAARTARSGERQQPDRISLTCGLPF